VLKEAHLYNGFNLVLVDICTSTMVYVFNRPNHGYLSVTPGIHVLTNSSLDAPWPKVYTLLVIIDSCMQINIHHLNFDTTKYIFH